MNEHPSVRGAYYPRPAKPPMGCGAFLVRMMLWALFIGGIVWVWRHV